MKPSKKTAAKKSVVNKSLPANKADTKKPAAKATTTKSTPQGKPSSRPKPQNPGKTATTSGGIPEQQPAAAAKQAKSGLRKNTKTETPSEPEPEPETISTMSAATITPKKSIQELAINTIRTLSMDGVQAANSGHPGTPMALAPIAYSIWQNEMRYDPADPTWPARDRFVLS